jgi:hypothetical protein
MNLLLLKLLVTPALIGTASLAGRRWGHSISGWLVALPLTTGPITFFLALSHGTAFAASAAAGTLAGGISQAVFVTAYGLLAWHWKWPATLAAIPGSHHNRAPAGSHVAARAIMRIVPRFLIILRLLLAQALRCWSAHPPWDIPLRMPVACSCRSVAVRADLNRNQPACWRRSLFTYTGCRASPARPAAAAVSARTSAGLVFVRSFFFVLAILSSRRDRDAFAVAVPVMLILQGTSLALAAHAACDPFGPERTLRPVDQALSIAEVRWRRTCCSRRACSVPLFWMRTMFSARAMTDQPGDRYPCPFFVLLGVIGAERSCLFNLKSKI